MGDFLNICIFANSVTTLSGGDKRFVELAKLWNKEGHNIYWITQGSAGARICRTERLEALRLFIFPFHIFDEFGILISYFVRICLSCLWIATRARKYIPEIKKNVIIYSSSDYWPDIIPAFLMKQMNNESKFVVYIHHIIPSPSKRKGSLIGNLLSYFSQLISHRIIARYANVAIVNNRLLRDELVRRGFPPGKIKVGGCGVDLDLITNIKPTKTRYSGIFVGRLHPSKGIFDLIKIWKLVTLKKKDAKIAIIGEGDNKTLVELKKEIQREALQENVVLKGFVKTKEVYKLVKSSKVFVSPSYEEGWGIAVAEAMACRSRVVAYDLPIYGEVFGNAIRTVPIGDTLEFSSAILDLLNDDKSRKSMEEEGYKAVSRYDWKTVSRKELKLLKTLCARTQKD